MPEDYKSMSLGELGDVARADDKSAHELRAAKNEVEKRATPNHQEINKVLEKSKGSERLDIDLAIVEGALRKADLWEKPLDPSKATELRSDEDIKNLTKKPGNKDVEGPEIFFKQIKKPKKEGPFFSRINTKDESGVIEEGDKLTDEVIVHIRLKNGKASGRGRKDENSIVSFVVKQQKGVLQIGKMKGGVYSIKSEAEFEDLVNPKEDEDGNSEKVGSLGNQFLGRLTVDEYKKEYKRENGKSLTKNWIDHDKEMEKKVDYWGSQEARTEMMNRVTGRYTEVLTDLNHNLERIKEETKAERKRKQEETTGLANNNEFINSLWAEYTAALRKRPPDKEKAAVWKRAIMESKRIDEGQFTQLEKQLGTGK